MQGQSIDPSLVFQGSPDLTPGLSASHWRELNLLLHSLALLADEGDTRTPLLPVLRSAATLGQADRALLYHWDESRMGLRLSAAIGFASSLAAELHQNNLQALGSLMHRRPVLLHGRAEEGLAREMFLLSARSVLTVPLIHQGRAWGAIQLLRDEAFTREEATLLWLFCQVAEGIIPSLVGARRQRGPSFEADAATGLLTPEQFRRRLTWEMQRAEWVARPLAILCVEVTEMLNSRPRGGSIGLSARDAARILDKAVHHKDAITCLGGHHYLVAMPDTSAAAARRIGDLIREGFMESCAGTLPVFDLVAGIATFTGGGRAGDEMIRAACEDGRRYRMRGNTAADKLSRSPLAG